MCHVRAEVTTYNAMPCGVVFLVKLLLDIRSNVLSSMNILQTNHLIRTEFKAIKPVSIQSAYSAYNLRTVPTFSILYFSKAWDAQSTASCCISSDISAFLITAFRSAMWYKLGSTNNRWRIKCPWEFRYGLLKKKWCKEEGDDSIRYRNVLETRRTRTAMTNLLINWSAAARNNVTNEH